MRNAKLWSVLLVALLLCACVLGVLFTGASASDSRIPTATTTYVVGTDGKDIRACLDKAAAQTWAENAVLEIQFSGTDSSVFAKPDAANGISGFTLFETVTIFREDDTQLPIVIRGMDADRAALIKTAQNGYNATNDYFFTNLTINGGEGKDVSFAAGSGELVFENCNFNNFANTYYYGDNRVTDVYEGWDAAKVAANSNEKGLVETGIVFGKGCKGLFATGTKGARFAAVGTNGDATTNPVISALKRTTANASVLTADEVKAVQEAAPLATFAKGNVVSIEDCLVKPWDTASYLIIDLGTKPGRTDSTPDIGMATARKGVSPIREARLELISGGCQYISVEADSGINETFAGDTYVIMRGGRSGRQSGTSGSYSDVGIRLTNLAMFVGDLTLEIHEDDPNFPTWTPWIQTSQSSATSTVFGNYHFLMTGGTIGDGTHANDGYWGAPVATGTIVNEVRGGKIWAFYGSRYANSNENTPVSTVLPGTGETLSVNVTVHNKISGGVIGELVDGKYSSSKGFHAQGKSSVKISSVCNEITGGTFYWFNAANSGTGSGCGDIYNFVSGTQEAYPTFLTHFYGTRCTVTTPSVTNVIKGYPVFKNLDGVKMSIFGGCANGTVTKIDNYLGGMPVFDDFYGGVSGTKDNKGVAGDITNTIALEMTASTLPNYVWGGNGYYAIKGVDGWTDDAKGNSSSEVTGSITCNVYSGHFGTFRCESAAGKMDVCPMTTNIYGGKWSSNFMTANRNYLRGRNTSETPIVVTTNIYDAEFGNYVYMGGQNANDREFVNNVYGGTFAKEYFGGGGTWAKKITNNIYGGTFKASYYGGGAGYSTDSRTYYGCGSESIVNNIYGGTFSGSHDYMGTHSNPSPSNAGKADEISNICEEQTIENNFYGGDFGKNWLYGGHRNGTTGSITNHFYSGEKNPIRTNPELSRYLDTEGVTTLATGTYLRDQVMCGLGFNEENFSTNTADSITNIFEGGGFVTGKGNTNITIRGGMRWGIVGNVTNNFISGDYYRVFSGCDFGYVTGKITNNFGVELEEGETAPALSFSGYVYGGGYDQTNGTKLYSEKIAEAKAAAEPTATQLSWLAIADEFGDDFAGGAKEIESNIYYGTFHQFFGGSYGSVKTDSANGLSHIDTITNNVYGGTFEMLGSDNYAFIGGCFRNAVIDTITNNIKGGKFNANYYGGTIGIGKVECNAIINNIDYAEGREDENSQFYFGNGGPAYNGTVTTVINDFKANKSYVYGGSAGIHNQPAGVDYGISTTINGGEFVGVWGVGGGTASEYTGNVKTTINGGTFYGYDVQDHMRNSFAGGSRNGSVEGNIEVVINDGTFTADVVGGIIWGSKTNSLKKIDGNVTTTIYGGEFREDIYALCREENAIDITGTATLNVEQTSGVALKLGGEATVDSFKANAKAIEIGANTNLKIANLEGRLNLNQAEGWLAHDYLTVPAAADFTITESPEIFGIRCEERTETTTRVYGASFAPAGATIRLTERVGVRFLLNKTDVDAYGDAFTFAVTMGDTTLTSGGKADLAEYQGYYSFVFDGIGLTEFATDFILSGSCFADEAYSIAGLATIAESEWAETYPAWAEYAGAIVELSRVYNDGAQNIYTPAAVEKTPAAAKGEAGVAGATATLLMSDAAGVRITATVNGAVENAKFKIGEKEIAATVTQETVEEAVVSTITADVFFAHEYLADEFVISVESDAGVHMTYTASIEAIAAQLAGDANNEMQNNATAFLYYIQKAVACK